MAWARTEDDDAGFLTILLDIVPPLWRAQTAGLDPQQLVEQLLAFINAYVLTNSANRLAVFASTTTGSYLLGEYLGRAARQQQQDLVSIERQLLGRLQEVLVLAEAEAPSSHGSGLSSGLSRALCYINRAIKSERAAGGGKARLLCLTAAADDPRHYIAVMNAIFSAQRSEVAIDCCKLGEGHSTFLQQAAHLTGGVYLQPTRPAALLQYLLSAYASDPYSCELLRLPRPTAVDFRTSCFCHKKSINVGWVCSVCLSIFCEKLPVCITCGADFQAAAAAKAPP